MPNQPTTTNYLSPSSQLATHPMPLDKLEIKTNVKLKKDYIAFINDNNPEISFNGTGDPNQPLSSRTYTNIEMGPVSISVLTDLSVAPTPMLISIRFNPARMLTGHNGYLLTARDILIAFTKLVDKLAPLLADSGDRLKLIPGVVADAPTYWTSLEIPAHLHDGDGSIFRAICNARHTSITTNPYHVVGESFKMKSPRGGVGVSVYFKDYQMKDVLRKHGVPDTKNMLRVEALLSKHKLVDYFRPHGVTRTINGEDRLVSFRPATLIAVHRGVMSGLKGFFHTFPKEATGDAKFLALVVRECDIPLATLLAIRTQAMGQTDRNAKKVERECRNCLAASSQLELSELFCDKAYGFQRSVCSPVSDLEYGLSEAGTIDPDVLRVYGPETP